MHLPHEKIYIEEEEEKYLSNRAKVIKVDCERACEEQDAVKVKGFKERKNKTRLIIN